MINKNDIKFYGRSVHIESINDKNTVERIYSLEDIMMSKGWEIYVQDYDEYGYLVIQLSNDTEGDLVNYLLYDKFSEDLIDSITESLSKRL